MVRRSERWDSDLFAFEVDDAPSISVSEQLEAADMRAGQHGDWEAAVDGLDVFLMPTANLNPAPRWQAFPESFGLAGEDDGCP